jgi:hypothetical protein
LTTTSDWARGHHAEPVQHGGVGIAQFLSGRVYAASLPATAPAAPYTAVFILFTGTLLAGFIIYLFSRDSSA